jgi:hypothetical protein
VLDALKIRGLNFNDFNVWQDGFIDLCPAAVTGYDQTLKWPKTGEAR